MKIYFTEEVSSEIKQRMDFVSESQKALDDFFMEKDYGNDLEVLFISIVCVNPRFANFFKPRKPKYQVDPKEYVEQGIQVFREGKSLSFDLSLNYTRYLTDVDPKQTFAHELLNSLNIIVDIKKIQNFDYSRFLSDFVHFSRLIGWLK